MKPRTQVLYMDWQLIIVNPPPSTLYMKPRTQDAALQGNRRLYDNINGLQHCNNGKHILGFHFNYTLNDNKNANSN